jgi:hypothetical protein
MDAGWQRNVVVGVTLAVFAAGYGLLSMAEGTTFAEGAGEGLWLSATVLAIIVTEQVRSRPARFVLLAACLVAIFAVYQLIANGQVTWSAAAWAVAAAASVAVVELILALVSRRTSGGRRPTST